MTALLYSRVTLCLCDRAAVRLCSPVDYVTL